MKTMATKYRINPDAPSYCLKIPPQTAKRLECASRKLGCSSHSTWAERLDVLSRFVLKNGAPTRGQKKKKKGGRTR